MSRTQAQNDALEKENRGLREKLAEARGELNGDRRGRALVAEHLVRDMQLGAIREEQHRVRAEQAYKDLQTALRIVAGHILDCQEHEVPAMAIAAGLLRDEFEAAGISLRTAMIAVQVERADAAAKVSASEAAAAVASAPIPSRTGAAPAPPVPMSP